MTPTINDTNRWIERCALHSYQRPVPQAVDRYLLPITDRVKGAALSVLRRSVFENYLATDLRKNRLNPLASLIFLLSFIGLTPIQETIVATTLLEWGESNLSPSSLNSLLAGVTNPSAKENAQLIITLFQEKIESFFKDGFTLLPLFSSTCNKDSLLKSLDQLLYFYLEYVQENKKSINPSFIENYCTLLKKIDPFSIESQFNIPAIQKNRDNPSYLVAHLLKHTALLSSIDLLNPLLKTLLLWPTFDRKIEHTSITIPQEDPSFIQSVAQTLFENCTYLSSKEEATNLLIETDDECFAVKVAIFKTILKDAKPIFFKNLLPLFEAINTYEPLKEALKDVALPLSYQLEDFSKTFTKWQRGAAELYEEMVENRSEDHQLFLAEIILHEGRVDSLRERYALLFPPLNPDL